ncbi:MAG TPA: ABC transporter ATP-binding protein, partial [Bacteroidia bacterium]|nr:ABC transporter ATP-binding protein [Bacteroidia bacterium]
MSEQKNKLNLSLLKRLLSYTNPYKKHFIAALVITLVLSGFAVVRPLLINKALNQFVGDTQNLSALNTIGFLIFGALVFEAVMQFANIYVTNYLGQNI